MSTVAVIDYGSSNLHSVVKALNFVADSAHQIIVSDKPEVILASDRVVVPGQGAIAQCMENLAEKQLQEVLLECLKNKPFLGICMGLQTLMEKSEEDGGISGLGVIPGNVIKFSANLHDKDGSGIKIPHMGWNNVVQRQEHPLWKGIQSGERFYFVHSFYVNPKRVEDIAATTDYALEFVSAIARDNLFAVQFHPEKSQHAGLTLLKNFLDWA